MIEILFSHAYIIKIPQHAAHVLKFVVDLIHLSERNDISLYKYMMEEVSNPFFIQQKKEREKVWNSKVRRSGQTRRKKIDKRKRKEECKTLKNGKGCVSAAAFCDVIPKHIYRASTIFSVKSISRKFSWKWFHGKFPLTHLN